MLQQLTVFFSRPGKWLPDVVVVPKMCVFGVSIFLVLAAELSAVHSGMNKLFYEKIFLVSFKKI